MAWLNTTPDKPDNNKRKEPPALTRIERYKATESTLLTMPDLEEEYYLVELWREIGMFQHGASGAIPLEWGEIKAYCDLTGVCLDPWEATTIRDLSKSYVSMLYQAREPNCKPPYVTSEYEDRRAKSQEDLAKLKQSVSSSKK